MPLRDFEAWLLPKLQCNHSSIHEKNSFHPIEDGTQMTFDQNFLPRD